MIEVWAKAILPDRTQIEAVKRIAALKAKPILNMKHRLNISLPENAMDA